MFFEQESIAFQFVNVFFLDQKYNKNFNGCRNYDSLSFRFEADTIVKTEKQKLWLQKDQICYFPAKVEYVRTSNRDKLIVINFKTFGVEIDELEVFLPDNPLKYAELFREILRCWEEKKDSYRYEASAILNWILGEIHKECSCRNQEKNRISPSLSYIEANYQNADFSLQEAAAKSKISDTYFRKLFREEMGISPKQYVIQKRMKYAVYLIETGYFTFKEVAEKCGYEDYKHFSTEFHKIMGVSPSKFRERK